MLKRNSLVAAFVLAIVLVPLAFPDASLGEGAQVFAGNTSVGSFFNRASSGCLATTTSVRHIAQRFVVPEDTTCNFYGAQSYDGDLHVYSGTFDPSNPTVNCIVGNDDGDLGIGTSTVIELALTTGTYTLVTSAFSASSGNGGEGSVSNTIHCGPLSGVSPSLSN